MDPRDLDRDVAGAAGAHQRLLGVLDDRLEREVLDPQVASLLPGWSVGHVLTHLARNADSHLRMLEGLEQYEGGVAGRAADIEAGAGRAAVELVRDVRRSIWALEGRWAHQPTWQDRQELPFRRWRETEIHHIDLGFGYGFEDLPADYMRGELRRMEMLWMARRPMGLTALPAAALAAPPHQRLAWLMGRARIPGLIAAGLLQ